MKRVSLDITGVGPMLMHSDRLANPRDPIVREIKLITSKRTMTDEDLDEKSWLEFQGGLYWFEGAADEIGGVYLPAWNFKRSFQDGAKINRLGQHVSRGVALLHERCMLNFPGRDHASGVRKTEADLFAEGTRFAYTCLVGVQNSRVLRTRPKFVGWSTNITVAVDPMVLDVDGFVDIAARAGRMVGIGDFRQQYGRFEVSNVSIEDL